MIWDRLRAAAPHLILILFLLLAFALRIYALEAQSMWSDEGLSLYRARQAPVDIFKGLIVIDGIETRDTNPPFYFLLLHLLRAAAGETIFALRYSGVLAGFLAVPLMYVMGILCYDRRVGFLSALLMAISPFHVWQSQVLRNYSLLVTFNLTAVYGLLRYILADRQHVQWRWLALWLVFSLLGIYTHYFGFFVFAFGLLILTSALIWRYGGIGSLIRQKRTWLIMAGLIILLLPAVFVAYNRFSAGQQVDFHHVRLIQVMTHAASAFAVGIERSLSHSWLLILPALVLFLAGILVGWWTKRMSTMILLAYQFIPLGLMLLFSIINPLYNGVRHLLIGLPPFILFVAAGAAAVPRIDGRMTAGGLVWRAWRWLRLILIILVLLIQAGWLYIQFSDPGLIRDDIRGAAEYLNEFAEPNDLIVLHDTIIGLTFEYYYDGDAPWTAVPSLGEQDVAAAEATLQNLGTRANRIWFLVRPTPRTGFPREALWDWAEEHWPRFFSRDFPSMWLRVQLNGYVPDPVVNELPENATVLDAQFDDRLKLNGVQLPSSIKAGEAWWATFYWSELLENSSDYVVSLRLVDENGRLWRQIDELLWHEYLDHQWPTGTLLRKDYEVTFDSGLPPGDYDLWLRILDNDRRPIPAADGRIDHHLGNVAMVAGTDVSHLPSHSSQRARLGEVEFLGYNLPDNEIRPGHGIPFELFWRTLNRPKEDYQVRIRLIDPAGQVVAESINAPSGENYPMTHWQVNEILQSNFQMLMPGNIEIVPHYVQVALVSPTNGDVMAAVTLNDQLTADPWPFVSEIPSDIKPLNVKIGVPATIALQGYDFSPSRISPGELLNFTLYWQAIADVPQGFYVFVHVMDEDGTIVAQHDGAPVQGFRPTMSWRAGEVIEDRYSIPIDANIETGTYQVWIGMYHPGSGERQPMAINGQKTVDNRALLQEITVQQSE